MINARDVPSRLEEFVCLKPGWLEGDGKPFDIEALRKLALLFSDNYPIEKFELPYTYPSYENRIVWEWEHDNHSISLYVSLDNFEAEWFDYNVDKDEINEHSMNLSEPASWTFIIDELTKVYADDRIEDNKAVEIDITLR